MKPHRRVVEDWRPLRWLPFIERRRVGLYYDTCPITAAGSWWREYRFRGSANHG